VGEREGEGRKEGTKEQRKERKELMNERTNEENENLKKRRTTARYLRPIHCSEIMCARAHVCVCVGGGGGINLLLRGNKDRVSDRTADTETSLCDKTLTKTQNESMGRRNGYLGTWCRTIIMSWQTLFLIVV